MWRENIGILVTGGCEDFPGTVNSLSVIAEIYFSQSSVIYFCRRFSYCPYYRGVRNSEVSARREWIVCSSVGILNSAIPPPCIIRPVLPPPSPTPPPPHFKPTINSFVSESSRLPVQTFVCLFLHLHVAKFVICLFCHLLSQLSIFR